MQRPGSVAVAMATFRRPDSLRELLPKVLAQAAQAQASLGWGFEFAIIVVDNDPDGSGREAALSTGDPRLRYVVEPEPGISCARNRALDLGADFDVLVFIDDDESPHPGWLGHLLAAKLQHGADAVSGPVQPVYEGALDAWVTAGDFHQRRHRAELGTGHELKRAATNNLLLDMAVVRRLGVRFDDRFRLTGGEDSFFTGQLTQRGARLIWCAEAVVDDLVPMSRANRGYILRRRMSLSNAGARVDVMLARPGLERTITRARCVARGIAQIVKGGALALGGRVRGSLGRQSEGERFVFGGAGSVAAGMGIWVSPYRRKPRVA